MRSRSRSPAASPPRRRDDICAARSALRWNCGREAATTCGSLTS